MTKIVWIISQKYRQILNSLNNYMNSINNYNINSINGKYWDIKYRTFKQDLIEFILIVGSLIIGLSHINTHTHIIFYVDERIYKNFEKKKTFVKENRRKSY